VASQESEISDLIAHLLRTMLGQVDTEQILYASVMCKGYVARLGITSSTHDGMVHHEHGGLGVLPMYDGSDKLDWSWFDCPLSHAHSLVLEFAHADDVSSMARFGN